jgi:hypothetical protein
MLSSMSGPLKVTDNRRPIVEPGGFVWPWSGGGRDLDIGQSAMTPGVTFKAPTVEVGPEKKERRPKRPAASRAPGQGAGAFGALAGLIIAFFALLHAAPHLTSIFGLADLFYDLVEEVPQGPLIAAASRAWAFEATAVWVITLIMRMIALQAAKKEARGGLALAALAAMIDAIVWFAAGRQGGGDQGALLLLLGAEVLLTFGLVVVGGILVGRRRRQEV